MLRTLGCDSSLEGDNRYSPTGWLQGRVGGSCPGAVWGAGASGAAVWEGMWGVVVGSHVAVL